LAVDTEVVLLVIPLKQPTEIFVYDPADNADPEVALFGRRRVLRKAVHRSALSHPCAFFA
jgi:hypothetical protein